MSNHKCPHPRSIVNKDERISRFIFDEEVLRTKSQDIFKPPRSLKISAYRTTKQNEENIWSIGNEYVAKARGIPVVGRVDIKASEYVN